MKNKKIIIASLVVLGLVAVAFVTWMINIHRKIESRNFVDTINGRPAAINNITYAVPQPAEDEYRFLPPQDALKTGEIAVAVNNLEDARQKISKIAAGNSGSVYATKINYSSNALQNGSMVIQIPVENFEQAFAALHSVGFQVVQESTKQIEKRTVYPMMQTSEAPGNAKADALATNDAAAAKSKITAKAAVKTDTAAPGGSPEAQGAAEPQIAIYPQPQAQSQDKGYINVIFADYGPQNAQTKANNGNFGPVFASNAPLHMLVAGLIVKGVLLIVLLLLLLHLLHKNVHSLHAHHKAKRENAQVKQAVKTRARVVKVAKRNRKL